MRHEPIRIERKLYASLRDKIINVLRVSTKPPRYPDIYIHMGKHAALLRPMLMRMEKAGDILAVKTQNGAKGISNEYILPSEATGILALYAPPIKEGDVVYTEKRHVTEKHSARGVGFRISTGMTSSPINSVYMG